MSCRHPVPQPENHEPEDVQAIVRGAALHCRNQGAILTIRSVAAKYDATRIIFLPSLVFLRFDLT